jgi:membrane associated rhomboid family serine protease
MFPMLNFLMFIPVPIKAKIFCPRFSISGFISRYLRSIYFGGGIAHFAHVGGALFGFNHVVLEKKISSTIIAGIKYYKKLFETNSKLKHEYFRRLKITV